jgi:hypothetical protein
MDFREITRGDDGVVDGNAIPHAEQKSAGETFS